MYNPSSPKVTIFIVTFNRLDVLRETLESYKHFTGDYDVVIVDNGTDNVKCVEQLQELEKEYKIFTGPKIYSMEELERNITAAVSDYFHKYETPYFVVSDCDCCMDTAKSDTLEVFIELCERHNFAVGPHYTIDIPANYALRTRMMVTESRILYKRRMTHYRDDIYYSQDAIDTTFVLFKRHPEFKRLRMSTIRVATPYLARHLDWYIDFMNPTEGNLIYLNKDSSVGSSGGSWIKGFIKMFAESKEKTFDFFLNSDKNPNDFCLNSFYLSWMYQYGHGCAIDREKAIEWMISACPDNGGPEYNARLRKDDLVEMIFNNNFSCLNG
jgi:glycosyltransferase involved in cell wall biosynthesis